MPYAERRTDSNALKSIQYYILGAAKYRAVVYGLSLYAKCKNIDVLSSNICIDILG